MKTKDYIIIGLIALGVLILLSFFMSLVISAISAFVAGLIVFFVIKTMKGKDEATEAQSSRASEQSADDAGIESLLTVNVELRKTVMPKGVRALFEEVIDQLIDLLPKANSVSPDGELSWVVNRMATEYLPEKSIRPYLALSETERHDQSTIDSVEEGLASMKSELTEVEVIFTQRKTNEFNTKAKFLKQRFNV